MNAWPLLFTLALTSSSTGAQGETSASEGTSDGGTPPITTAENCGDQCTGNAELSFIQPTEGAIVIAPVEITVDPGSGCQCDTCGCFDVPIESLTISARDVDGAVDCLSGSCSLDLPAGDHELVAQSSFGFSGAVALVRITVVTAPSTTTSAGSETSGEAATGDDPGSAATSDDEGSGCSCSNEPERRLGWLWLLAGITPWLWRRLRSPHRHRRSARFRATI